MFIDKLISRIKHVNNPTVFGLDPKIENIPTFIKENYFNEYGQNVVAATGAILYFCKKLIDELHDVVPAVKIQSAYFELYGIEGIKVLKEVADYAKQKGLLVIGDVKRNDIDTTAAAYSTAYLGQTVIDKNLTQPMFDFNCITVNPYLGSDGIMPFIEDCKKHKKGLFILVKTSNKSSGQIQDLKVDGKYIYEIIAEMVNTWGSELIGKNGYSSVGAVVGATYPEQAVALRKLMPNNYFLVPGFGAQGACAKDIAGCFNNDGLGAIINASRSIMYAYKSDRWKDIYKEELFAKAAKSEVFRMRDEINEVVNIKTNYFIL